MHRYLTIVKNPGLIVPESYWGLAIKQFPSALGVAVATKVENDSILIVNKKLGLDSAATLAAITKVQEQFKAQKVIFSLAAFPEKASEDDIQPFTLAVKGEDDEQIVAFIDGAGARFDKGEGHSAEFHCWQEALGPIIGGKMYKKIAGEDLKKFSEELADPVNKQVLNGMFDNAGTIAILTLSDNLHTFSEGEQRKAFPFGFVSQHLGYTEDAAAAAPSKADAGTPVTGKKPKFDFLSGGTPAAPAAPQPTPVGPQPDKPVEGQPGKTLEEIIAADDYEWRTPPDEVRKNNGHLKSWYKEVSKTGKIPQDCDWKNYAPVRTKYKKTGMDKLSAVAVKPVQVPSSPAERAGLEAIPVISTEATKSFHDWLAEGKAKKLRTDYAGKYDVSKMLELTEKLPNFEQAAGLKLEESFPWDYGLCLELARKHPEHAALAIMHFKKLYMEDLATAPETPAEVPEPLKKTGTDDTPVSPPRPPTSVPAASAKKPKFNFG